MLLLCNIVISFTPCCFQSIWAEVQSHFSLTDLFLLSAIKPLIDLECEQLQGMLGKKPLLRTSPHSLEKIGLPSSKGEDTVKCFILLEGHFIH